MNIELLNRNEGQDDHLTPRSALASPRSGQPSPRLVHQSTLEQSQMARSLLDSTATASTKSNYDTDSVAVLDDALVFVTRACAAYSTREQIAHGLSWLSKNGIVSVEDLRRASKSVWLGEHFPVKAAIMIEDALALRQHEETRALYRWYQPRSVDILDATLANYGVVSALILTISASALGGLSAADWHAYNVTFGNGDYWTNVNQYRFIYLNVIAVGLLLLEVVACCVLYISFHSTDADFEKQNEKSTLLRVFAMPFLIVNLLFVVGVVLAGFGFTTYVVIKAPSVQLGIDVQEIMNVFGVLVGLILLSALAGARFASFFLRSARRKEHERQKRAFDQKVSENAAA